MDEMTETQNSLEDWIAFKTDLFANDNSNCERHHFLVAFNHMENTIAITCLEETRRASDKRNKSIASSLSLNNLIDANKQLCLVRPKLDEYFQPVLQLIPTPNLISRTISYELTEELCKRIDEYLNIALSLCGRRLLFTVLFDVDFLDDFEENIQELRQKGFENLLNSAIEELDEVLKLRSKAETLLEMSAIYVMEDQVISKVLTALAELYYFQLQPFLKLRELSYNSMQKSYQSMNSSDLGQRVKNEAKKEYNESKEQYLSSTEAQQQLYQEYYRKTVHLISEQTLRMRADKQRFGESAFQVKGSLNRLQTLELFASQERLELLNTIKTTKEFQKNQLKQQLSESSSDCELKAIESEVFEMEINILETKLKIISEEEKLIKQKIEILETENKRKESAEEFFDAIEDERELESICINQRVESSKYCKKLTALKKKLSELSQKRAVLRTRNKSMLSEKNCKQIDINKEKENYEKHNKIQTKRKIFVKTEQKISEEKYKEMRRKTLQRLKNYKLKALLNDLSSGADDSNLQTCDNEEELPLPPYPHIREQPMAGNQSEWPEPPPPQALHFEQNSKQLEDSKTGQSLSANSVPVPPPLPPPPFPGGSFCVPPPPPPLPPPIPSTFPAMSALKLPKRMTDLNRESVPQKTSFGSNSIDLNEILRMRDKLKPTLIVKKPTESPQNCLAEALKNRCRVTEESDLSDNESDQDFDE